MNDKLKIIGLAGTNGAGKDSVGAILAEDYGFWFFSFTELFRAECRRRGIEVTRANTSMISGEWRRESGLATLIDRSMTAFEAAGGYAKYRGAVISSLRNPAEPDRIHELGGTVLWIDADVRTRYDRIQANAALRARGGEDNKTFEQFQQEEYDEMHTPPGGDAATLNGTAVKERADIFLFNDDGKEALRTTIGDALGITPVA